MKVTMDPAGRIVLPKPLRDELHLDAGAEFDVVVEGWSVRLDPIVVGSRRIVETDGWPVLELAADTTTTDDDVRRWRDADQR